VGISWPGSPASGTTGLTTSGLPDKGVLRLHLGGDGDYFRFDATGASTTGTPWNLTSSTCAVTATGGPVALTAEPARSSVGIFDHGLGVSVKGEGSGSPCGRVDGTQQKLTLTLAGALGNYEIDVAELDIERKFGAKVVADLSNNNASVASVVLDPTAVTDSGPDAAAADNVRWRIDPGKYFDTITLRVDASTPGGAFSLEGGNDGTAAGTLGASLNPPTKDSLFHIVDIDGALGCTASTGNTATEGGGSAPGITVTRGANSDGSTCAPVAYALDTATSGDDQTVLFRKDLSSQATAVFTATITWAKQVASYPSTTGGDHITTIDYGDVQGVHPIEWCLGTPAAPELPDGEFWCLTGHVENLIGDASGTNYIQVVETLYGEGDPGLFH
jgi:hypothetical protein